ncbi:uncharacterized transposon-derived protein F52C9.6 [Trichonephila clavipes]|nr:uncharacterized transposon-derived protein F52C9.6 [Trichonephila clavipes]
MASFERKGGVNENNSWRRRYNFELYRIYKQLGIIKYIKVCRMNWMAHIIRMPDDNIKKILQFKVSGIRKRGRPRQRRTDSMESGFGITNEKTWRTRDHYGEIFKGRPTKGCLARYDDDDDELEIFLLPYLLL